MNSVKLDEDSATKVLLKFRHCKVAANFEKESNLFLKLLVNVKKVGRLKKMCGLLRISELYYMCFETLKKDVISNHFQDHKIIF